MTCISFVEASGGCSRLMGDGCGALGGRGVRRVSNLGKWCLHATDAIGRLLSCLAMRHLYAAWRSGATRRVQ